MKKAVLLQNNIIDIEVDTTKLLPIPVDAKNVSLLFLKKFIKTVRTMSSVEGAYKLGKNTEGYRVVGASRVQRGVLRTRDDLCRRLVLGFAQQEVVRVA